MYIGTIFNHIPIIERNIWPLIKQIEVRLSLNLGLVGQGLRQKCVKRPNRLSNM